MKKKLEKLNDLLIEIYAHANQDFEVTINGNGTNCSEALNVAYGVIKILHGSVAKWKSENKNQIKAEIIRLRSLYRCDEDGYWNQ